MSNDFIQHHSTAVQMTIDTSGKAEPPAPVAPAVKQGENAPAKSPAQGENVAAIEAKVKAGEVINLTDLSDAMKKDKAAAKTAPNTAKTAKNAEKIKTEKPSIKDKIAAGKEEIAANKSAQGKTAAKNKNAELGE